MVSNEVRIPRVELRRIIYNSLDAIFRDTKIHEAVYDNLMSQIEDDIYDQGYEVKGEQRWIPVSERLPEENVAVLTQAKFKDDIKMAVSARQDYNYWTGWGTREVNIVAWMPLPEPYKETEE